jgi:hypothetical protein
MSIDRRPTIPLLIALTIAGTLAGCSWMTRFAVTNDSDSSVRLVISAEVPTQGDPRWRVCPIASERPLETTMESLGRWRDVSWQKLPANKYRLDKTACQAEIDLRPGESVSITQALNYTGHRPENGVPGQIASLSIHGKDGEISRKGWEIVKHFQRLSDALYVYTYR